MTANKSILKQYRYLTKEVEDLKSRIKRTKEQLNRLESMGTVKDKVKGGYGGIQGYEIEGFPLAEYSKKKTRLLLQMAQYENDEAEISDMTQKVHDFIHDIPDSRDRMVFRYFYIDGLNQQTIANRLHIDQSVVSRTLDKY